MKQDGVEAWRHVSAFFRAESRPLFAAGESLC
jgi:hypothetical protein